jgi:DNA-binding NtrC family response regulator
MGNAEILFVEDDPDSLDAAIEILREAGYETVSAVNADIGLILLEQGLPFRLLITDIVLPGRLDGFALARRAKEIRPQIEIIYATAFPVVAGVRSRGAPWGKTLLKPFGRDDLLGIVESVFVAPASSSPIAPRPPS